MNYQSSVRFEFNHWIGQDFGSHIKISNDGTTITRIIFSGKGFEFNGKNPLKLPKKVQAYINSWMHDVCIQYIMAIWDIEAWTDYDNTRVVH